MSKFVYADNAATTNVSPEVLREMMPYFGSEYGNPSSLYSIGRSASLAISAAREKIASLLGAKSNEIYFTSCGSESDNWAIKGAAHANAAKGKHTSRPSMSITQFCTPWTRLKRKALK